MTCKLGISNALPFGHREMIFETNQQSYHDLLLSLRLHPYGPSAHLELYSSKLVYNLVSLPSNGTTLQNFLLQPCIQISISVQ